MKTYEYLAAGLPVIATPAGIPAELAPYVDLATTAEELVEQAETAMRENDATQARARRAAVADETWDARAAEIEQALGVRSPDPRTSEVSVVIVSFNTRELLERCLTDLGAQAGVALQTIVVDNASSDGSRDLVRQRFPEVELIELPENVGFARANNLAFERCRGQYVLLLNSDAFMHPGAIAELVAVAERHPEAGAVGPRLLNPDGSLQRSAWPFPDPVRLLLEAFGAASSAPTCRALRRSGHLAARPRARRRLPDRRVLAVRADVLMEVHGFDERFWLYAEETDLQRRFADRGRTVVLAPRAVATHVGSASSADPAVRLRQFYAGQRNFLRKHRGEGAWLVARLALLLGSLLRRRWRVAWIAVSLR